MTKQITNLTNDVDLVKDADFILSPQAFTELSKQDPNDPYFFIVGDIMGRYDLLDRLVKHLETPALLKYCFGRTDKVIFLGNYVGAKGNTCETFDRLRRYKEARPDNVVLLRGKGDHYFLRMTQTFFNSEVGIDTIDSYRKPARSPYVAEQHGQVDTIRLVNDRRFVMEHTQPYFESNHFFCCSAGVNPDKSIKDQNAFELMFKRFKNEEDFEFDKFVFHGDAIVKGNKVNISRRKHRLCLDTGASLAAHGVLSCAVVSGKTGQVEEIIQIK